MKEIPLSQRGGHAGKYVALVDDEDYEALSRYQWFVMTSHHGWVCAARTFHGRKLLMHRVICGEPRGMLVDHKDRNGLNNQKANFRVCSHQQNLANSGLQENNKSGFIGVHWQSQSGRWRATVGNTRNPGSTVGDFKNVEDAARARDKRAREIYGEFAVLNFP